MNILIVDDDQGVRGLLADFIAELSHPVNTCSSGEEALSEFQRGGYDMLFLDLQMPGMDGFEVLRQIKEINNDCEVIIITAYGSVNSAIQALNMGAYAYINKPFDFQELERIVDRVNELNNLRQAYRILANERLRSFHLDNLIAISPPMKDVKRKIIDVCASNIPILLFGEPGSGKRFISRIIHFNGPGKESQIIQLNAEDIENLFEKGSYQHSDDVIVTLDGFPIDLIHQGYGTIILNNINNISSHSMRSLSDLLTRQVPSGSLSGDKDLRVIALIETPPNLRSPEILIIEDFWRYFEHVIRIPPLRERSECVVALAQLLFQSHVAEKGGRNFYISQPVREFLKLYDWPGNIDELGFVVDRLAIVCTSRLISATDLQSVHAEYKMTESRTISDLGSILTQAEKSLINKTFQRRPQGS